MWGTILGLKGCRWCVEVPGRTAPTLGCCRWTASGAPDIRTGGTGTAARGGVAAPDIFACTGGLVPAMRPGGVAWPGAGDGAAPGIRTGGMGTAERSCCIATAGGGTERAGDAQRTGGVSLVAAAGVLGGGVPASFAVARCGMGLPPSAGSVGHVALGSRIRIEKRDSIIGANYSKMLTQENQ
jgi:hypothetical protein